VIIALPCSLHDVYVCRDQSSLASRARATRFEWHDGLSILKTCFAEEEAIFSVTTINVPMQLLYYKRSLLDARTRARCSAMHTIERNAREAANKMFARVNIKNCYASNFEIWQERWREMGELIAVYFRRLLLVCVMVIAVIFPDLSKRLHLKLIFDSFEFRLARFFSEKS